MILTLERRVALQILPPQLVRNKGEDLKDLSRDGTRVSFVYGTSSKDVVLISDFQ